MTLAYSIPLFIAWFTVVVIAVISWTRRDNRVARWFGLLMLSISIWTLAYALELLAPQLSTKTLLAKVQYIGITTIPVLWLIFVLHYTDNSLARNNRLRLALFIVPVYTLGMVWTNEFHLFHWADVALETINGVELFSASYGFSFWIYWGYSNFILLFATIYLFRSMLRSPQLFKGQIILMLTASLLPWLGNILYITRLNPAPGLDLTPFGFSLSGVLVAIALYRYRLFDVLPTAYQAVFASLLDAIIVLNEQRQILNLNTTARTLLGQQSPIGQPLSEVHPALAHQLPDGITVTRQLEIDLPDGDGKPQSYDVSMSPLRNQHDEQVGQVVILRDITELKHVNRELRARATELEETNVALQEARKDAEESSRLKSEFLANMSHELRTPLNAINGFTQLMLSDIFGELNPEQRHGLERMQSNGNHLLNLINDILDLSKIEAGRFVLNRGEVDVHSLGTRLREQLGLLAVSKSLDMQIDIDTNLPDKIIGDDKRLLQILTNLTGNAIKFTDEGAINIGLHKLDDSTWRIEVRDTGVGIPSHALDLIFDEFRQVDGSMTREHDGSGLGLAIVNRLILLMGGSINVDSTVGEGSTFTVDLPLLLPEDANTEVVSD